MKSAHSNPEPQPPIDISIDKPIPLHQAWPQGLCHEMGWFCTERILHLAQDLGQPPKPGSWYALAAKKQWIEAKLSDHGLHKVIAMSQRLLHPGEGELPHSWDETDGQDLRHALHNIQGELTLEEQAWMEADTAEFLAHEAITRLLWNTIQPVSPALLPIIRATETITQHLYTANTWKHYRSQDWTFAQRFLQHRLDQAMKALQTWQQQQWLSVLSQYQCQEKRLLVTLVQRGIQLHHDKTIYQEQWEESLFL